MARSSPTFAAGFPAYRGPKSTHWRPDNRHPNPLQFDGRLNASDQLVLPAKLRGARRPYLPNPMRLPEA